MVYSYVFTILYQQYSNSYNNLPDIMTKHHNVFLPSVHGMLINSYDNDLSSNQNSSVDLIISTITAYLFSRRLLP